VRYAWIDQQVGQYPLSSLCWALSVSVNGYRAWKRGGKPGRTRLTDTQLLTLMRTVHAEVKGAYGSPRMTGEIRDRGFPVSKERVERLMRENGIRARAQAPLPGDNRLEAQTASRTESVESRVHACRAEPGVQRGHHVHLDRRGLAIPGRGARSVQPGSGGLVDQAAHDGW
jgi:hypothetical protein